MLSTGARAIGVDTKDGPLPSAPLLAHSMASLQRANSNYSINATEDDSSFKEQTVIAPRYVYFSVKVGNISLALSADHRAPGRWRNLYSFAFGRRHALALTLHGCL